MVKLAVGMYDRTISHCRGAQEMFEKQKIEPICM